MEKEMNNNMQNCSCEKKNNNVKVLLIILIVLAIAILSLLSYKIFIVDKKNDNKENDNNVVDNENSNNYKHEEKVYANTIEDYFRLKEIKVQAYNTKNDFSNFESVTLKNGELGYKINNIYIVLVETTAEVNSEYPNIKILDKEYNELAKTNKIFYANNVIYYADITCDLGLTDIPSEVKNDESHIVNKLYKINTKEVKKQFLEYVGYNGSSAC